MSFGCDARRSRATVAPSVASFFAGNTSNPPAATAASLFAMLPVVIAYLFLQKYFVQGLVGAQK
ncbi:hypothetical protein ACIBO6_35435 [Streptomyces luteogriseus]|uniref:hypothetical protein n=1 Tax=Streptomyces luteogriseus TaxID=68233 RepID=UPI00379BA277